MKQILIVNQKGGVGKSLIADELAFSFERTGIPVTFYDLDNQGGTIHKTRECKDAQVAVIDTPGALQPRLKDWVAAADLIVIPTKTTSRDIETLQRMQDIVKNTGKQVIYVLNGWNRWKASKDFLEWFEEYDKDAIIYRLPQSEQFVQAGAAGMSVIEYSRRGASVRAMQDLCNAVREVLGFPKELTK